jgi:DNA-binding response OmpR family regulator
MMRKMKRVLLVFDDSKELEFIEANLAENGFQIFKSDNLKKALINAEKIIPDLIVVNTIDKEKDLELFSNQVKTERLNNVSILSLIELEDYLKASTKSKKHFIIKPLRPKLLLSLIRGIMNNEEVSWLSATH